MEIFKFSYPYFSITDFMSQSILIQSSENQNQNLFWKVWLNLSELLKILKKYEPFKFAVRNPYKFHKFVVIEA